MPVLLGAEQIAAAADLHVAHGNAEARAELRVLPDRREPLFGNVGQRLARTVGEVGIRAPGGTPHAPAQLM